MELVNISYTGTGVTPQDLSAKDSSLVTSNYIFSQFGRPDDVIELHISGENGEILLSDYNATDYYPYLTANPVTGLYSSLTLDPEKDVKNRGFNRGAINAQYNFLSNLFNSSENSKYWIKEISRSRTEIKLASQTIPDSVIKSGFNQFDGINRSRNYYVLFYLNFGNNQLIVANNVLYTEDEEGSYLLIKLYEPLPSQYDVKDQLWIVEKVAESVNFQINIEVQIEEVRSFNALRGPNYNVVVNTKGGQSTPYYTYNDLLSSPITSSFQKLNSYYQDKAVAINIDYSNFSNFIKFSSATERLNNFIYKLGLIESSLANIGSQSTISSGPQSSIIAASSSQAEQKIIDNIIKNFDTYEYFLYFESSSWAWPKSNSTQPYTLFSVTSSEATSFIGSVDTVPNLTTQSLLWSASYYDSTNKDILRNTAPQYILEDPSNQPFVTFLDMVGQHFDNLWIYYKDVTNRFNATNSPDTGISLDLVSDALKGLGFQLFTNTNVSDNLYYSLFGINPDGSLLPPTGSEQITSIGGKYVTSSLTTLPAETIQDEIYKRLYHNIPYLYKTKGTARSIKSLISIYGIPEEILTVREFGGEPMTSVQGILDMNSYEYKVGIATGSGGNVTGSITISSSLLSPYTTLQYYQSNRRINNPNIEVGFSPADVINNNITSSIPNINVDQLIGSPGYQYSSSYTPLVSASLAYFSSYTNTSSVWEYIRLLKFYNNSLFKTIKEFVPARANVSTGIIIKSHMLERNKYARHEPSMSINVYSQSIDMIEISGSEGSAISDSTEWNGFIISPIGRIPISSSNGIEKYTGELSGSKMVVTDGFAMQQGDYISHTTGSIDTYNYGATHQNITGSVRSTFLIDLDYNSNQLTPVNYGIVTRSLSQSQVNRYDVYTNPNNLAAQVQDYNYNIKRSTGPRYSGVDVVSSTYNTYKSESGDRSYGKTAAIDKIKYQYAYLVDIYSSSAFLPGRSNAQIKYVIDNDQNVLDLTKANKNIFEVQNIFKSGETTNISLFDYDETNPYIQQLANDPTLAVYEGGWRYLPILHNVSRSSDFHQYILGSPTTIQVEQGSSLPPDSAYLNSNNYQIVVTECSTVDTSGPENTITYSYSAEVTCSVGPIPLGAQVTLTIGYSFVQGTCAAECSVGTYTTTVTLGEGQQYASVPAGLGGFGPCTTAESVGSCSTPAIFPCYLSIESISGTGIGGGGGSTKSFFTYYTSVVTSSQSCLYYYSQSNEIVFNSQLSHYYAENSPLFFSSSSDKDWSGSGLPPVILPFSLAVGDKISFFDSSSRLGWNELNEYTIKNVRVTGSTATLTGSVLLAEVVERVNLSLFLSGSSVPTESITKSPFRSCRYIVWKHVPDETNVMLRFNPKDPSIIENGLLFPQYIDTGVRDNAGNVVKALKQQNLI